MQDVHSHVNFFFLSGGVSDPMCPPTKPTTLPATACFSKVVGKYFNICVPKQQGVNKGTEGKANTPKTEEMQQPPSTRALRVTSEKKRVRPAEGQQAKNRK